ncbi:hypothetical protein [Kitasatospora sp. NPDC093679]
MTASSLTAAAQWPRPALPLAEASLESVPSVTAAAVVLVLLGRQM